MTENPLTDQQLDEIEARADAATSGPWELHEGCGPHFYAYLRGSHLQGIGTLNFGDGEAADADREFVTRAHGDVDQLLAEVRRLRTRVAELEEARRLEWQLSHGRNPHTPLLCECGHSHFAHTVPSPHSCFAFAQTCPCEAFRQLPHDRAVAQLKANQRAAAERAKEAPGSTDADSGWMNTDISARGWTA
jgi:hypothetical protein